MLQAQLTTGANVGYVLPNAPPTMTMGGMQYAPMGFQVGMNQRFVGMPSGMQVIMPGMQPGVNLGYATPVMMMGMPMHNQLNQFQMLQGQHQQQQMQLYQQMQQHQIQQQILNQKVSTCSVEFKLICSNETFTHSTHSYYTETI